MKNKKLEKIVLIGPVYPYKGGISHYTGLMYRSLAKKYKTIMVSYKLQYPKFMFKKEQKDYENDSFKIENTRYSINTANPFNWVKVALEIRKIKPDLVIFQWWHPYFTPCYFMLEILMKNIKKMFICHNVFPHERFPLDRFLTKLVLRQGNCFVTQSKLDTENLLSIEKNAQYIEAVHPTYNVFKFENMSKKRAREILDISQEESVLLFFGFVREYKGLKYLLKAMKLLKQSEKQFRLLVVGDFGDDRQDYMDLIKQCNIQDMIEIYDGYIPDREVEKYFAASDLVVLPYESATQSGIVQIAYGFEIPVVVTNVGGLPDVVQNNYTGYVAPPKSPEALAEKIEEFFSERKGNEFIKNIKQEAYKFSWEKMNENIEQLYNQIND